MLDTRKDSQVSSSFAQHEFWLDKLIKNEVTLAELSSRITNNPKVFANYEGINILKNIGMGAALAGHDVQSSGYGTAFKSVVMQYNKEGNERALSLDFS